MIFISSLLYSLQSDKGFTLRKLIGNCAQITSCPATVGNAKVFINYAHCAAMRYGKGDKNVTSQETCLYRIDNAFVE